MRNLIQLLRLYKKEITSVYFYAAISGLIQLTLPLGIQTIIGLVMGATMVTSIYVLILLIVISVILVGIFQYRQIQMVEKIQQKIFVDYSFLFTESIPRVDLTKVDRYYLPEKVNRFFDVVYLQKGFSKILLELPIASIQLLLGVLLLSFYHPFFIIFCILLLLIVFAVIQFTARRGLITSIEESNRKYEIAAWLEEIARVVKSFKLTQGTHYNIRKTDEILVNFLKARNAHFTVLSFQFKTLILVKFIITLMMLLVGTYLLIDQKINIGEFVAAELVILTLISASEKVITSLENVYDTLTGLEKLNSVVLIDQEDEGFVDWNSTDTGADIRLEKVSFTFQDGSKPFSELNFEFNPNERVWISGTYGSGKSSLIMLLSGNYNNYSGVYTLNNVPVVNIKKESMRKQVGLFFNEMEIFSGTLLENITLERQELSRDKVLSIANKSGLGEFIKTLPKGLDTKLDSMGKNMSSKIVKKILLLRAISNKPSLLLMDEPFDSLSSEERISLLNYLKEELKNSTMLISTHDYKELEGFFTQKINLDQKK